MNEYKKEELSELLNELERQKKSKERYDIIVPTDELKVISDEKTIFMDVPQLKDGKVKRHEITNYCHHQIAEKCDIPYKYYNKMKELEKFELLVDNVNEWLPQKDKRFVRVLDNKVRALLSDRYRVIDNYDVFTNALKEFNKIQKTRKMDIDVLSGSLTETNLYVKATSPQLTANIKHFKGKEEVVEGGIIVTNSEVGAGAFSVKPFINVLVCQNGLISQTQLKRVHIGRELKLGMVDWSTETLDLQDKTLWSKIRDMIQTTFDPAVFMHWIDDLNDKASTELLKPKLAVDNVVKKFDVIPKSAAEDLLDQLTREGPTQWGLAMAVTRVSQKLDDYNKQIEWEKVGAEILELDKKVLIAEVE